jgi:hypothetical protein
MDANDIETRFTYHPPSPAQVPVFQEIRDQAKALATKLNEVVPNGREKSLAITHLEDTVMWANAGIARHGLASEQKAAG